MGRRATVPARLVCPACGERYGDGARFCESCRLPVVVDRGDAPLEPVSERHRRARKVKPQLAEGPLTYLTQVRNQTEGEFVQGMLLEHGVPSLLRRSAGFDVPDFLAAGPRDVLVPRAGWQTAREVLLEAELIGEGPPPRPVSASRLMLGLLVALALGAGVVWAFSLAAH
jgi:hypothetical protein